MTATVLGIYQPGAAKYVSHHRTPKKEKKVSIHWRKCRRLAIKSCPELNPLFLNTTPTNGSPPQGANPKTPNLNPSRPFTNPTHAQTVDRKLQQETAQRISPLGRRLAAKPGDGSTGERRGLRGRAAWRRALLEVVGLPPVRLCTTEDGGGFPLLRLDWRV